MIASGAWIGLYGMLMLLTSSVWANRWWIRRYQLHQGITNGSGWFGLLAINVVTLVSAVGLVLSAFELLSVQF